MAQFCTKCGSPLADGMQFCTVCGATVGQPQAAMARPPAPAPPAPVAAPVRVAAPAAVPGPKPPSGSPVVKIILIVLAVFIFLGVLGMGACVYIGYRAKQRFNQFQKQVTTTFPMPSGTREVHVQPSAPTRSESVQTGPVVDTGVPVYPGAIPAGGSGQMSLGTTTVKTQQYLSDDSVDKVAAFYKDKVPDARVIQSGNEAVVQSIGSGGVLTIGISPDANSGKTKIAISNMTK